MTTETTSERVQKANGEAKVLLSVILGFTAVVVLFMVFMMANAPRGSAICDEDSTQGTPNAENSNFNGVLNAIFPLHPSLPGSEDCIEPVYFDVSDANLLNQTTMPNASTNAALM